MRMCTTTISTILLRLFVIVNYCDLHMLAKQSSSFSRQYRILSVHCPDLCLQNSPVDYTICGPQIV